jgi:CRISPR-associated protein Cst1
MTYTRDAPVGLRWTGHPLVDMGVAGLTVFAQQRQPENVTGVHLEEFVTWAQTAYFTKEIGGWLAVAFTSNFINPSFTADKKRLVVKTILESYRDDTVLDSTNCAFFPLQAQQLAARDLIPMLLGREPTNFFADGQPGIPLSGLAITALQGLSLATPLVGGRMLIVAADDPKLLLYLVKQWQPEIRNRVQLSQTTGEKSPGWSGPRSRLIEQIINIERLRQTKQDPDLEYNGSATIYHASNSGQGPDMTVYSLELPALRFVRKAQNIKYLEAWRRLASTWREPDKDKDQQYAKRNDVYEAVFELPLEATKFIRRFFLFPVQRQLKPAQPADMPKRGKKTKESQAALPASPSAPIAAPVALWNLLELFLQEVLGMDRSRIDGIRTLGDRIAEWIDCEKDKKLFRRIVFEIRRQYQVRDLLIKLSAKNVLGGPLRIDEYLNIFEEGEELAHADFGLAWDLTRMRIIESLFDKNYFETNKEALDDITIEDQE